MQIRAAVLERSGNDGPFATTLPLTLTTLELDPPGPGELLVRIEAAGLCHSDLSVINGNRVRPMPMALGHEAVATVVSTGDRQDTLFAVGDRVVLTFLPACGECVPCASGEAYLCARAAAANGAGELLRGGRRLHRDGDAVHHHLGVSAFADHAVIDRRSAVKIDADIPVEIAALFGCAVLTGAGAVFNSAALRPGEGVAIYGLGGVGLAALIGSLAGGATPVVAIDPSPQKRALGLELGAAGTFAPDGAESQIETLLGGKPDIVIETVGKASVLEQAYALTRRGGRVVTVGLPNPMERFAISPTGLVGDNKTIIGSYLGASIPARDIPRYIALWRSGRMPVERLLSSVSPLAKINTLFDILARGDAVRQVVIPHLEET
ncbi:zinc-binding dehydrogenase [Novosphingobium sp. Gsoil 351]|uniref:zinc-binding dehydrogenase n=1 Tax=Novosphingobium sp. Gsoil 351 TaxID=2675225 RepID=UPI0012B453A4|nr:zinc-binding dehydrogenase [Novosphingobium sp. Gsoil 351]QGN55880.1 alcohol dehydrogenase catalytic domain-containing protein [Novosphingobium sp. Gsoil 351]